PRRGELRRLRGHSQVALRDELAAGGSRCALHPGEHRLRQRGDGLHHAAALREELDDLRLLLERADFLEIVAGAEPLARGGEDHDANLLFTRDAFQGGLEGRKHLARKQVHLLRAVHGQRADPVAVFAKQDRLLGFGNRTHMIRTRAQVSMAAADFALSRSRNFWILPVEVLGSSQNTTARGVLNLARWPRQNSIISFSDTWAPALSSTKAYGVSPHFWSGLATTAAASTAGCRWSTSSTSSEEMFSPPEMM